MNKILLLMLLVLTTVLGACSKDNDGEGQRGVNGERLVSKVIIVYAEDGEQDTYEFQYDKNGQMTKAVNYYDYYTETYTYTRSENKLIIEHVSVDEREKEDDLCKTVCVLNNKGLITSFSFNGNKETQMTYNDKNQLINDEEFEYTWKDGNIIKRTAVNNSGHTTTYTYSNYEKKTNISDITAIWAELYDYSYFGAMNKNLITSSTSSYSFSNPEYGRDEFSYEYEFDKDGYVIAMKEYNVEKKVLCATYNIEYK